MRIAFICAECEDIRVSSEPTTTGIAPLARDERRWGPRIQVDFPVRLELARGRSAPGRMRNASVSGALIECAVEMPTFTQIRVEILVDAGDTGGAAELLWLPARVVRAEHPRFGVEWRDLAPEAYTYLLRINGLPLGS
jgi:PilZ domain